MQEHFINIREAAEYLDVGERRIKELVDAGEIPAYKIGGTFLRFRKSQLVIIKASLPGDAKALIPNQKSVPIHSSLDGIKDFFYFNDFYILSIIIIVVAFVLILAT